jgi:hypothetical protein
MKTSDQNSKKRGYKMRKIELAFILGLLVLLIPALASAQDIQPPKTIEYIVISDTANLRAGAGTNFNVVGTVSTGDSLLVYDETPEVTGWLRVYRPNQEDAYIADFLVERAPMRFYPPDQEPILVISGRGKNISEVLDLPRGAYRIDAVIQDNSFILETTTIEGDCDDEAIFNELNFDVNRLVISGLFVSSGCSVIFETDNVDGDWEISIRDLLNEDALASSLLGIENGTKITGAGRTLTMATFLPEGIWTISGVVNDQAFILRPQVLTGDCDSSSVFNELDFDVETLEISTVYRSEEDGCIIFWETFNVEGSWEMTFEQIR